VISLNSFRRSLFDTDLHSFDEKAIWLFRKQATENPVYRSYLNFLGCDIRRIDRVEKIPFLPIGFFREHRVAMGKFLEEAVFESSATTGSRPGRHYVRDLGHYRRVCEACYSRLISPVQDRCFLALLPSYLERPNSSLVHMMEHFMSVSRHPASGFFLRNFDELAQRIRSLRRDGVEAVLFGVTFGLLDFAEYWQEELPHITVMETGGMKGRKREMTREEVYARLRGAWGGVRIYSEYGMTELMSQAYTRREGIFITPPWMRIMIRDLYDPFQYLGPGRHGAINVIDLANIDSCAFIETQDLGMLTPDGGFMVLGRTDDSELRGCSLMLL
jgi:hypothetical protein